MAVRLMLLDDDPTLLHALSHMLRHHLSNLSVETSSDPASALEALHKQPYAVVLTDVNMPGMNGLQFLRAARDKGVDASFIVMTGNGTDDMVTEGLRLGMFALVHKPLHWLTLIPLVQQAMECYRLRQEVATLQRTVVESGVELGRLMRTLVGETEDVGQATLPY